MNDEQLLRYARHIMLDDVGIAGQQSLLGSRVLLVGAGGLGCAAALYLGSAGLGQIRVLDPDRVDLTNLQRQIAHTQARIGQPKVDSLAQAIAAINPDCQVQALAESATADNLDRHVEGVDLVLDCSDNFQTRQHINAACVRHGLPLVSAAAMGFDAQISVFHPPRSGCYACLFPPDGEVEEARCADMGVFAPLVGIVGAMQAAEAIKCLCQIGQTLAGRLLMLDGKAMQWREMALAPDPGCPVCSARTSPIGQAK